jgi:hypothetical protein
VKQIILARDLMAGSGRVFPFRFEVIQKGEDDLRGKVMERDRTNLDAKAVGDKRKKQFEGIPVGLDAVRAHPFDVRQIGVKKLMDNG